VESSKYERNEFIFNFALVLDENDDFSGYTTIVRKLALLFRNLEEQSGFLSKEEHDLDDHNTDIPSALELDNSRDHTRGELSQSSRYIGNKIYALCEMMFEDLNHYCECMIPIGMCPPSF
jgi:nitrogen permease regulator 2-like protein